MLQSLIGQVFNLESGKFDKVVNGVKEQRTWVRFRLGADKPYKEEVEIAGQKEEMRQKTFITTKAFNGLGDTIKQYFGGDENKGKWIQVFGHWEEESFPTKVEVDNPADANQTLELTIPVKKLVFMVSHFNFIGPAPVQRTTAPKTAGGVGVTVKTKTATGASAADAEKALTGGGVAIIAEDDSAPF